MQQDPKKCSMLDCNNELGPDALVFEHKGQPAGGVCEVCLGEEKKVRVVFEQDTSGIFEPINMNRLG